MSSRRCLFAVFLFLPAMIFFGCGPAFSSPPIVDYSSVANSASCTALQGYVAGLTDATFGKPVTNVTTTWNAPSSGSSFCEVTGWIWPELEFQVNLPTQWNERYVMNGGGGWDGNLMVPTSANTEGYASSSVNGGYMAANWPSSCGSFGLKEPYFNQYYGDAGYPTGLGGYYGSTNPIGSGNPYACQKVVDFGYRQLYETPVIAKKIVQQYYQKAPKKSYYSGGSCGGKEGQISAQKFPELYDGYYIGFPLGGHVAVTFRGTWDTLWGSGLAKQLDPTCVAGPFGGCATVYSQYKAALHYKTVYSKCDGVDGLVDGIIDDPRNCKFDAMTDLPACSPAEEAAEAAGAYSSTCFTLAERQALAEIYAGPHNSEGMPWYPGQPLSAEYVTASGMVGFASALDDGMAPCMFANIALNPPMGPYFEITSFDWNKDPVAMQETTCIQKYPDGSPTMIADIHDTLDGITISPQPGFNMGGFGAVYAKGAKIVQETGWSDSLVTPLAASVGLYETALETMGVEKTKSFWKLYMVPGAGHGGGGLSCWPTNAFDAMVDWVENGIEPGALIGSRAANTDANYPNARTRPSCPYPEVARWNGISSNSGTDNAVNFSCVPPINVGFQPGIINLDSKGQLTAFITMPEGYKVSDWGIQSVSCQGAPMVQGSIVGNTYVATFNIQKLTGVSPGPSVTLEVKLDFLHQGMLALTQGYGTVEVTK